MARAVDIRKPAAHQCCAQHHAGTLLQRVTSQPCWTGVPDIQGVVVAEVSRNCGQTRFRYLQRCTKQHMHCLSVVQRCRCCPCPNCSQPFGAGQYRRTPKHRAIWVHIGHMWLDLGQALPEMGGLFPVLVRCRPRTVRCRSNVGPVVADVVPLVADVRPVVANVWPTVRCGATVCPTKANTCRHRA